MSSDESNFKSLEECLNKYIPDKELKEVKRILYGRSDEYWLIVWLFNYFDIELKLIFSNALEISDETKALAEECKFEVKAFKFTAAAEDLRKPRIVKVIKSLFSN